MRQKCLGQLNNYLVTKSVSLNNEPCLIRPALTDLNPVELGSYPVMISLDKCNGSCNVVDGLSTKMCVPIKTKDINVKVFYMIIRINEVKTLAKYIQCNCKCKFDITTHESNEKWNSHKFQRECKSYCMCKKRL